MNKARLVVGFVVSMITAFLLVVGLATAQDEGYFPEPDLSNPAAPFIFTEAYAASKGATAEWRKQEGVVIDAANKKFYTAITRVTNGMGDTEGDIQLAENRCGMVLVGDLDENWNLSQLRPLIVGGPYDESNTDNPCNVDNISEPDNLFVDGNGDLWIGEDTNLHKNNALWKYEVASRTLMRFATVPVGAEVTGLRVESNGTLFMNVQHPDPTSLYPFNRGIVGVVVGYKATDNFTPLAVPQGDEQLIARIAAGEYQILGRAGDAIPGNPFGQVFGQFINVNGQGIEPFDLAFCNHPDGTMFLPTNSAGNEGYLYTNFECNPGVVSKLYIRQDVDGRWNAFEGENVDFASVNGTWSNCNASVSPWNTGLTSEEFPAESAEEWLEDGNNVAMDAYVAGTANPYDYGYVVELIPSETGTDVVKHYAMGRASMEQAWVAPDSRTTYIGNDGTDRIFYKFVAAEAGDLSVGTLYAAKVTQSGENNIDQFSLALEWIELAQGNNADVEAAIRALDATS